MVTIVAGIFAGLVLGIGGAFAMNALDPRLRREEQLRELYSLPILARVPKERRARRSRSAAALRHRAARRSAARSARRALAGDARVLPHAAHDARRAAPRRRQQPRVLVTGPSPSEGKTTTAINLASSLALAGNRVILIEADFRRPTVGEALGVRARVGIGECCSATCRSRTRWCRPAPSATTCAPCSSDRADDWLAEVLSLPAAEALLEDAKRLADYVVLDSPPLTQVIDAMPLARQVDDVVLVMRLGSSNLPSWPTSATCSTRTASSRPASWWSAARRRRSRATTARRSGAATRSPTGWSASTSRTTRPLRVPQLGSSAER